MQKETFAARYDNLALICAFVKSTSIQAGLSARDAYSVELATNEACTNIIEYAYRGDEAGTIVCLVSVDDEGVTIEIVDRGEPFSIDQVPEPDFSVPLEELQPHGAGLRIIRGAMDEVEFESLPEGGTRLTMRKNR